MKNSCSLTKIFLPLIILSLILISDPLCAALANAVEKKDPAGEMSRIQFEIDAAKPGKKIGNKLSNVNLWMMQGFSVPKKTEGADLRDFVEYVQFMQSTGSSVPRELFKNPEDRSIKDDYNFEPMERACRTTLELGAKPHIKVSVPLKYAAPPQKGVFNTNVYPPEDWDGYYRFIRALAKDLVDKFGKEEVLKWRWGCLVEFENKDWFKTQNGKAADTRNAYLKLYDYTVDALIQELGPNVFVGAHAMACAEGLWDERDLLDHCARGINYKTGKKGTRICFMAASYYDYSPGRLCKRSLPEVIDALRDRAESVGLTNLIYGVDEGRILSSRKGKNSSSLTTRIVGQTYQAASDARLYTQMTENNIDYFSAWSYSTASVYAGYPTVAWHVASNFAQFKNSAVLPIQKTAELAPKVDANAVAGFDEKTKTFYLMAYNFKPEFEYKGLLQAKFSINIPQFKGQTVAVKKLVIDDSNNFYNQWLKDRKTYDIGDDCFSWSPDSCNLDACISNPQKRKIYNEKLRPVYVKMAQIQPTVKDLAVSESGQIALNTQLGPHAVVFYVITLKK